MVNMRILVLYNCEYYSDEYHHEDYKNDIKKTIINAFSECNFDPQYYSIENIEIIIFEADIDKIYTENVPGLFVHKLERIKNIDKKQYIM